MNEKVFVDVTEKPAPVTQGVAALWGSLLVTTLTTIYGKWTGHYEEDVFIVSVLLLAIFCIIPYKVSVGSNAARYWFIVLAMLGNVLALGGVVQTTTTFDFVSGLIVVPFDLYAIYKLFHRESNQWFAAMNLARR